MITLTKDDIIRALPMDQSINAMKDAFIALSCGKTQIPLRTRINLPDQDAASIFMPAYLETESDNALAIKIVSVFPENISQQIPTIHAIVIVLNPNTGKPVALLEGSTLTAIRTGAASGAATDILARQDSHTAAVLGPGAQGRTQLEAICTVRDIHRVWVYGPIKDQVAAFIEETAGKGRIPQDVRIAHSSQEAIRQADIICTATTSKTPVFADRDLKPGTHINGIGSFTPEMKEIPTETILRSLIVVDSYTSCLAEAGDLIQPIRAGLFTESAIHAELGEILSGMKTGRSSENQITIFKSVGVAVQDAAAARLALTNANNLGLGHHITM